MISLSFEIECASTEAAANIAGELAELLPKQLAGALTRNHVTRHDIKLGLDRMRQIREHMPRDDSDEGAGTFPLALYGVPMEVTAETIARSREQATENISRVLAAVSSEMAPYFLRYRVQDVSARLQESEIEMIEENVILKFGPRASRGSSSSGLSATP